MQIRRFKCYDPEATVQMTPLQLLIERIKYLDQLLKYLKADKPDQFDVVIMDLQAKLEIVTEEEIIISSSPVRLDLEVLDYYPHLLRLSMTAFLIFLNFAKYEKQDIRSKINIRRSDIIRSWFLLYYLLVSLTSIMPKPEAVQYYQSMIDSIVGASQNPDEYIDSINELRQMNAEYLLSAKITDFIEFKLKEGAFGLKTVKCLWAEVFEELDDPIFAEAIACYKDFPMIKNINEYFLLTRTQTLVGGQDYCDACCHDTRVDKMTSHPSKSFWNNLA